jgi:hypothetical protein
MFMSGPGDGSLRRRLPSKAVAGSTPCQVHQLQGIATSMTHINSEGKDIESAIAQIFEGEFSQSVYQASPIKVRGRSTKIEVERDILTRLVRGLA